MLFHKSKCLVIFIIVFSVNSVFSQNENPYLQTITPTSVFVSWFSDDENVPKVNYGINDLSLQETGQYEIISGNIWNTVKLSGLSPNTVYQYNCETATSTSVSKFKTPPINNVDTGKIRFLIFGDSRTEISKVREISQAIEQKLIELYGEDWYKSINFAFHVGDMVQVDSIDTYNENYFTPYANLTKHISFMVTPGNHEYYGDAINFFKYMKYDDFSSDYFENTSVYNEQLYKFRIGSSLFISANSDSLFFYNDVQKQWLQNILEDAESDTSIDFVFAFCHHPAYSELYPTGNSEYTKNEILGTLAKYPKAAMLSSGHTHGYNRGVFSFDSVEVNAANNVTILTSGGGGAGLDRWRLYSNQRDCNEIFCSYDYYEYTIVEVDVLTNSYNANTYSLGNRNHLLNNVLIDSWYQNNKESKPDKPETLNVEETDSSKILIASVFSGNDSLMSAQFQIKNSCDEESIIITDTLINWKNIYFDTGSPTYIPIDLNRNIEINKLNISLVQNTFQWRVRYRDFNLKWSDWSDFSCYNSSQYISSLCADNKMIMISPNPSSGKVNINIDKSIKQIKSLNIYDENGVCVKSFSDNFKWDFVWDNKNTHIKSSCYYVVLQTNNQKYSTKIIVVHH